MEWLKYIAVVLGIIVASLSIYKFFRKSPAEKQVVSEKKETNDSASVASRFLSLFEAHGIHRNEIPRFFDHDLTLSKLKNNDVLLENLTDTMLKDVCELFSIRRQWLDGVDKQIYPLHDFYKSPEKFIKFIQGLKQDNEEWIDGVLLVGDSDGFEVDALIILEESVGHIGNKLIYRYHICDNWMFKYWKSRGYLTACIAAAWQKEVFIMGRKVSIELIRKLRDGNIFLEYEFDNALPTQGVHWHPEDMVIDPEKYLDGVDPERENFGLISGLKMWLSLHDEGYMKIDLPYENVREKFQQALLKNKN